MSDWIEELFYTYSRELYWIAMALCSKSELAEDAVQETFLYMCEHREAISRVSDKRAYLIRIVRSFLIDYFRHERTVSKHAPMIVDELKYVYDISRDGEYEEMLDSARFLLTSLPEECRKIFVKAVIEGMSYKQIAVGSGISVNTVKTQIKIAYKRLKKSRFILVFCKIQFFNILFTLF